MLYGETVMRLIKMESSKCADGQPLYSLYFKHHQIYLSTSEVGILHDITEEVLNCERSTTKSLYHDSVPDGIRNLREHHMRDSARISKLEKDCCQIKACNDRWCGCQKHISAIEVANRSLAERVSVVETDMIGHAGSHMKYNLQERVNNLERKVAQHQLWLAGLTPQVTKLQESNEQRKKDIKHSWNVCDEVKVEVSRLAGSIASMGNKLNNHLIEHYERGIK